MKNETAQRGPETSATETTREEDISVAIIETARQLLENEKISMCDNFFDAGGDSISAVRLAHAIRDKLGIRRSVRLIFESPTLGDLCNALHGLREEN
jgi:acyl carrier protein